MPDVILPVLDEAAAIPWVLGRMPADCGPIVVDNGSTDGSAAVARRLGAQVVAGAAPRVRSGVLRRASSPRGPTSSASWTATDRWIPATSSASSDPSPRARRTSSSGRATARARPHARLANAVVTLQLRRRAGVALRDLGPMRAAARVPLVELGIEDRRFGWPLEMVLRAARAGWRVAEVDVPYRPREGRSKVTGTVRGTLRTIRDMARLLAEIDPIRPRDAKERA